MSGRRFCHSGAKSAGFLAMASMSYDSARVTTSARNPSMTERACLPDPPCDWVTRTLSPVLAFQCLENASLYSA